MPTIGNLPVPYYQAFEPCDMKTAYPRDQHCEQWLTVGECKWLDFDNSATMRNFAIRHICS